MPSPLWTPRLETLPAHRRQSLLTDRCSNSSCHDAGKPSQVPRPCVLSGWHCGVRVVARVWLPGSSGFLLDTCREMAHCHHQRVRFKNLRYHFRIWQSALHPRWRCSLAKLCSSDRAHWSLLSWSAYAFTVVFARMVFWVAFSVITAFFTTQENVLVSEDRYGSSVAFPLVLAGLGWQACVGRHEPR